MNMMNVQWYLYYDPEVFTVSEELNSPESICPTIGDKAAITYGENVIIYCSSSINLYDFSTKEVPFVKIIFNVNELDPEQPVITKCDLTVDVLCASELDPKTRKSDVDKEVFFVSNSELSQRAIDSVRLSRNTYLTPSNFVQATTAPVTTGQRTSTETLFQQLPMNPRRVPHITRRRQTRPLQQVKSPNRRQLRLSRRPHPRKRLP